jgi:hypothetical protein
MALDEMNQGEMARLELEQYVDVAVRSKIVAKQGLRCAARTEYAGRLNARRVSARSGINKPAQTRPFLREH